MPAARDLGFPALCTSGWQSSRRAALPAVWARGSWQARRPQCSSGAPRAAPCRVVDAQMHTTALRTPPQPAAAGPCFFVGCGLLASWPFCRGRFVTHVRLQSHGCCLARRLAGAALAVPQLVDNASHRYACWGSRPANGGAVQGGSGSNHSCSRHEDELRRCFQPCLLANVVRLGGGWLLRCDKESHVTGTSFPPRWSCMLNLLRLSFGISHVSS